MIVFNNCEIQWENNNNIERNTVVCTDFFIEGLATVSKYKAIYMRKFCGILIKINGLMMF